MAPYSSIVRNPGYTPASKMSDTTPAAFQPTRWSLVLQARGEGAGARRALEDLCQAYWFPLYSWSRRFGASPQDAEDYVQGFFMEVMEKALFSSADQQRGKLRTFLLTAFRRHVNDVQRAETRIKRGSGQVVSFDALEAESWYEVEQIDGESADAMFDRQWALTLLDKAMSCVEESALQRGKAAEFHAMRPFLTTDASAADYEAAGKSLGMSANTFKVAVHRLRARFRDALRKEVAETERDGGSVQDELRYLMEVLSGAT
jgi:RNA polymerase sigma factor (sigma-70 family)